MVETTIRTADTNPEGDLARRIEELSEGDMERLVSGLQESQRLRISKLLERTRIPEGRKTSEIARETTGTHANDNLAAAQNIRQEKENELRSLLGNRQEHHAEMQDDEHHKGEDRPPPGGFWTKTGRTITTAGVTAGVGAGALLATQGVSSITNTALFNVPALQTAAAGVNTAAIAAAGWTPWLSWLAYPLEMAAWATPGLAVGAATVGGLWALGKIREGAERREFYKHNPTGRFEKKTFLKNVAGGAGWLLSPLKLIPGIPRAIGSVAGWGLDKINGGFMWIGNNSGTIVKGAGVGTLVGGGLLIAGALASPAAAVLVGAGTAGLYTWLNHKDSSPPTVL